MRHIAVLVALLFAAPASLAAPALAQSLDLDRDLDFVSPKPNDGALDPETAKIAGFEWTLTGRAEVIDGDTIRFNGARMRLVGIDAPELDQVCYLPGGVPWGCGIAAKVRLEQMIGSDPVRCFGYGSDSYRRNLVRCISSRFNLNSHMLAEGLAVYSPAKGQAKGADDGFAKEESGARAKRAGIWSGAFQTPAEYRRTQPRT